MKNLNDWGDDCDQYDDLCRALEEARQSYMDGQHPLEVGRDFTPGSPQMIYHAAQAARWAFAAAFHARWGHYPSEPTY